VIGKHQPGKCRSHREKRPKLLSDGEQKHDHPKGKHDEWHRAFENDDGAPTIEGEQRRQRRDDRGKKRHRQWPPEHGREEKRPDQQPLEQRTSR
jgi:hypothetical protein